VSLGTSRVHPQGKHERLEKAGLRAVELAKRPGLTCQAHAVANLGLGEGLATRLGSWAVPFCNAQSVLLQSNLSKVNVRDKTFLTQGKTLLKSKVLPCVN